jgi:hypothetical protein
VGGLAAGVAEASAPTRVLAKEVNFRAAGNQCASHHHYDDHNGEFHVTPHSLGKTAVPSLRRCA